MSVRPPRTPAPLDPERDAALTRAAPELGRKGSRHHGDDATPERPDLATLRARIATVEARHAATPRTTTAPDPGRILARLARTDGTELRVSLHRFEGKPYVRVAPWQSSAPDAWPVKGKGATVKVRELAVVAAALLDAMDAVENDDA